MAEPSHEFFALQQAVVGRYSIEREVGRGGMGIVFLARDVALDRLVALKMLPPTLAAQPDLAERFLREARTAARLSHPNIVTVHAVERHGDVVFFAMGFVVGETLGQRVRRAGALPASEAARVVREVAWALAYAHANGVVHRDIKPDNVLIERGSGRAMVTDFGIARLLESTGQTAPGEMLGTPNFMSPEQALGSAADGRSDLYALGITAFFALTGRLPFEAASPMAVLAMHVNREPPSFAELRVQVPDWLGDVVRRCLAKIPDDRFASGEALAEALSAGTGNEREIPWQARIIVASASYARLSAIASAILFLFAPYFVADPFTRLLLRESPLLFVGVSLVGIRRARGLLKGGMNIDDIDLAFARMERLVAEQVQSETSSTLRTLSAARGLWYIFVGAILTLPIAADFAHLNQWPVYAFPITGLSIALLLAVLWAGMSWLIAVALSTRRGAQFLQRWMIAKFRRRSVWTRRIARAWLKIGSIGLPPAPQPLQVANQPTELGLAGSAQQLFDELPPDVRGRLARLPGVVSRLQAHALRGRAQDHHATRGSTVLALAVAALENIRLDLLRLKAGAATVESLTADLDAAESIGRQIDIEIATRGDLDALLTR